jgi:hypothetical protein
MKRFWRALTQVAVLAAVGSPAAAEPCQFVYTAAFHDTVVLPRLKSVLKDKWADWDDPKPEITIRDQMVRLQFANVRPGAESTSVFVLRSDNCGRGPHLAGLFPAAIEIQ